MRTNSELGLTTAMKEAIERSGYLFELRLVPLISRAGYKAMCNDRLRDENGSFELDVYAISAKQISKQRGYKWVSLLIECKNLRCPLVLFAQEELRMVAFLGYPHISGLPQQAIERGHVVDLTDFLKLNDFHHYYTRSKVVTQFCAVSGKKKNSPASSAAGKSAQKRKRTGDDYVAGHKVGEADLYDDGLRKLVRAVRAAKRDYAAKFSREELGDKRVDLWFFYPILVTAGPLYECLISSRSTRYRRIHRAGFLHRGELDDPRVIGDCRLDVVDPQGLRDIIRVIDRETDQMLGAIRSRYIILGESRRKLASRLSKLRRETRRKVIAGEERLQF